MAQVGIVMGSDSDMPIMAKAADILEELGVSYEMTIISAHREPDVFFEYAKTAEAKGFKVIIAGAGMAAHLPGMCAAIFPMPVIGIPMHTTSLGGRDSLYSIVQMPSGIPVATVAINGGANAALLAAQILAVEDVKVAVVGRNGRLGVFAAKVVHHEVACYAEQPVGKLAVLGIISVLDGYDRLDESFLKNIFGQLCVVALLVYVAQETALMTLQQRVKSFVIAVSVLLYQLVVGELG